MKRHFGFPVDFLNAANTCLDVATSNLAISYCYKAAQRFITAPTCIDPKFVAGATLERCDNYGSCFGQNMKSKPKLGLLGKLASSERAVRIFQISRSALCHSAQLH